MTSTRAFFSRFCPSKPEVGNDQVAAVARHLFARQLCRRFYQRRQRCRHRYPPRFEVGVAFHHSSYPAQRQSTAGSFPSPDAARVRRRYGDRVRPRVGLAGLAVRLDPFRVEAGVVVVAGGERLLHHHRRQLPVLAARLVALVADGVADLVVDQVLAVGADIALERHRPAHPAGLVDEHPRLAVGAKDGL